MPWRTFVNVLATATHVTSETVDPLERYLADNGCVTMEQFDHIQSIFGDFFLVECSYIITEVQDISKTFSQFQMLELLKNKC